MYCEYRYGSKDVLQNAFGGSGLDVYGLCASPFRGENKLCCHETPNGICASSSADIDEEITAFLKKVSLEQTTQRLFQIGETIKRIHALVQKTSENLEGLNTAYVQQDKSAST